MDKKLQKKYAKDFEKKFGHKLIYLCSDGDPIGEGDDTCAQYDVMLPTNQEYNLGISISDSGKFQFYVDGNPIITKVNKMPPINYASMEGDFQPLSLLDQEVFNQAIDDCVKYNKR